MSLVITFVIGALFIPMLALVLLILNGRKSLVGKWRNAWTTTLSDSTVSLGPGEMTTVTVTVEVPAGSLVIFHGHMPHYSSQNLSARSRQAFTMQGNLKQYPGPFFKLGIYF